MSLHLNIDGKDVDACEGQSILLAALKAGIYIPHLCFHPDLPSFKESMPDEVCYQGENEFLSDSKAEGYKGCGLCVASCRSGALHLKGFETSQIMGMIDCVG